MGGPQPTSEVGSEAVEPRPRSIAAPGRRRAEKPPKPRRPQTIEAAVVNPKKALAEEIAEAVVARLGRRRAG